MLPFFKIALVVICVSIVSSCYSKQAIEARIEHQAKTGERLNQAQRDTEVLFKDME